MTVKPNPREYAVAGRPLTLASRSTVAREAHLPIPDKEGSP